MSALTLIALGLLAGAGFMWRELRRAPLLPPDYDADQLPPHNRPTDVKQYPGTDGQNAVTTREQLLEKLRLEEQRQRPWEARN